MTVYYVRKTGDDITGDGTTALPWLTIPKAVTALAAGDTLKIGSGTYASNSGSGYLSLANLAYASTVTIESESGSNDVIIQGASSSTYNTRITGTTAKITFKNLTFAMRVNTNASAIKIETGANLTVESCAATVLSGTSARYGFWLSGASGTASSNITFTSCSVTSDGTNKVTGMLATTASSTLTNLTLTNCMFDVSEVGNNPSRMALNITGDVTGVTITGGTYTSTSSDLPAIYIVGAAGHHVTDVTLTGVTGSGYAQGARIVGCDNLTITNGIFTSVDAIGLLIGTDGFTGESVTGTITGARASSEHSHAMLIGAGATGIVITGITSIATEAPDIGFVFKEALNCSLINSVIFGGGTAALYFKASTGCSAIGNRIGNSTGYCLQFANNNISLNKVVGATVTNNRFFASGSASLFNIGADVDLGAGNVVDYNYLRITGTGNFGDVYGTEDITTLAGVRTAWSTYETGSNDAHSSMWVHSPVIYQLIGSVKR
jgi:hypothetical protein